ncbi:unnamed protein product [Effrenium voratum]|nr:unnamed protein product [Effrenium voratum]
MEVQKYKMQVERFELFREDIEDLVKLTVDKMDMYHLVSAVVLGFTTSVFTEGRIWAHSPPSYIAVYFMTIGCGWLYLLMTVWLSMYASISSHSLGVRLRTRYVRLPIPSMQQLYGISSKLQDFEQQGVQKMLRLPFGPQGTPQWQSPGPGVAAPAGVAVVQAMPSSCAMLRCLGLALALPVVLPVAAKPRELFEIGKVDIETGLEPFFEGNMEPFGVVCVAYVKEGGANHRLMKKLGAVTEEDEALWTLQVPMAAALDWRSEESVALVRRSYAASLWAMVQQGPLDAEELVFTAKGAWKEKELRKWLLQNAYPTINYRVPGYRGKKHPFPFDKYFGKANSGGVGLVLVKMKDLDDFGPQFRAVQFMRPHIEQLAPQIRFAVVEKSPSTLEMRRALKVGLDESLEAELILFEDLQGYGGDVDNHFHGNHRKYRLTNFTQDAVDGFFAAYHERALPTFWASLDEGKASLPSELRAGDFEREVYGAEKGLGVAVVFVNDPKDGCKACADGREVWESVQQQVRLNSQLRKRLRLLLLDQSRNEHPEQLVPGRLGQPLVVFYPPGSAAQRRKRRQVMHALSESFYKEAILERLQDLVEDVEASERDLGQDLLGRGEAGFGQEKVLTSAASTAPAEHVQMFRKLQSKWQCFDAYARVSMSLGVYQIVQAINLFVLGLTLVETHCPSVALAVTLLLQAVALALNFLDLAGLHAWQWAVMLCISSGCSVITAISLIGAKLEPDGLPDVNHPFSLAPLAYWFQALYFQVLLVLACPSDEQSSLPRRFRAVLFLDVFGDASYDPTDAEHALIPKTVEEGDMSGAAERAEKATQLAKCWDLARMAQMALRRWEAVPDEHVRAEDAESLWQLRKQYTVWRKALLVSWGEMNEARGIPYSAEARDRVELRPWNQLSAVEKSEDVFTGTLVGPLYSAQGNQTFHYDLEKGECIFGRGKSLSLREVASRVTAFQRGVQSMLALSEVPAEDDHDGSATGSPRERGGEREISRAAGPWVQSNGGCRAQRTSHGWALVATRKLGQGEVILAERPVLLAPPHFPADTSEELKATVPEPLLRRGEWLFALHCACGPLELLTQDLAIFAPEASEAAEGFRAALEELGIHGPMAERLLRGLLLCKFASFPLHGAWEGGRCLFGLLSKLNHSCYPNCACLWSGQAGDDGVAVAQLRAVTRISEGEELTFSYLGNDFPLRFPDAEARRERLWRGFAFRCGCELCVGEPKTRGQLARRALAYGKPPPPPPKR